MFLATFLRSAHAEGEPGMTKKPTIRIFAFLSARRVVNAHRFFQLNPSENRAN